MVANRRLIAKPMRFWSCGMLFLKNRRLVAINRQNLPDFDDMGRI